MRAWHKHFICPYLEKDRSLGSHGFSSLPFVVSSAVFAFPAWSSSDDNLSSEWKTLMYRDGSLIDLLRDRACVFSGALEDNKTNNMISLICHFGVHLSLHFKVKLSVKSLLWNSVFCHIQIGTNYHNKSFALRLALKERLRRTRKWSIDTGDGKILEWVLAWTLEWKFQR